MNNTTVSTAAASVGAAGAFVVVAQWLLSLVHVQLPADVGAAVVVVLGWLIHTLTVYHVLPKVAAKVVDSAQTVPTPASPPQKAS